MPCVAVALCVCGCGSVCVWALELAALAWAGGWKESGSCKHSRAEQGHQAGNRKCSLVPQGLRANGQGRAELLLLGSTTGGALGDVPQEGHWVRSLRGGTG